ncbi:DUF262 domain-containing protein [Polaromonas sp. JS666]|uniref:DUF262 domain-containing protein n=1 Tax=Polaromonas sp. (strain JS666 / ATCC BAA-500) TaxID=296591 RepID=UPI0000538267|nr:DUF262 domain-containing protein [Polaromonas sp. JS666]ABE46988.1 conserved hypothetical protein [Polaromonas sp. JS666]
MSYIPKTISEVVLEYINRTTFLPAIQREYVWDTEGIEKLFDSIMGNYLPSTRGLMPRHRQLHRHHWQRPTLL